MVIVITGGPGSGKTTLINALKNKGFFCLDEVSREITENARKSGIDQLFLAQPLLFSELLLEARMKQFQEAKANDALYFLDRGVPDILAYMHYIGDSYPSQFVEVAKSCRYDHVFILEPWEAIYVQDSHRYENFAQAQLIYQHLIETYGQYAFNPVVVNKGSVEDRLNFILNQLKK
jgi:predicted ATPase